MKRFRHWRRRRAAAGLLAAATIITVGAPTAGTAAEPGTKTPLLNANKKKVGTGSKIKLRGQFGPQATPTSTGTTASKPPAQVQIQFKPAGKKKWRKVAVTGTNAKGQYAKRVKVKRSGHYRAAAPGGRFSESERVRAKSRVRARLAKNGDVNLGDKLKIKGRVKPAIGHRKVVVKVGKDKLTTKANRKGKFTAKWKADNAGNKKVRVKARGDKVAAGSKDKAGKATVFRPGHASWYGPGLYGNGTACGGHLTPSTIGVAHKTLPCGTKVEFRYHGKSVKAKVIDRGPYVAGREWDLTEATKNKLGFPGVGTVWTDK